MRRLAVNLFRSSLALLPRSFRLEYGQEMADVFSERIRGRSVWSIVVLTIGESFDIALVSARTRTAEYRLLRPTFAAAVVMAVLLGTKGSASLPSSPVVDPSVRIDFYAHDPAGQFTLTILDGHPIAATMNRVPLSLRRVVHQGDSIRIIGPEGNVALALAYYRESGRIEWTARPAACRSASPACRAAE